MFNRVAVIALLCGLLLVSVSRQSAAVAPEPSHGRPFFMPEWRRQEILELIRNEAWAKEAYAEVRSAAAEDADWFWAGFLYALEGDKKYARIAAEGLRGVAGWNAVGWWRHFNDVVDWDSEEIRDTPGDAHWPHMSPVWYGVDVRPYVVYDWVYDALSDDEREDIHKGLHFMAKVRMRVLDTRSYTPNLLFKPMFMVAFAGLALQDEDLMQWGFHRTERQGNYDSFLNGILVDGGPWHEAPIYAIRHQDLQCMTTMAFYRHLYDGGDWFEKQSKDGGSPQGLMDYYIDSAYPIENIGVGQGRLRTVTHGHGATRVTDGYLRDQFLVSPIPEDSAGDGDVIHEELALSYAASGAKRYEPFVAMIPDYQPNLWDRRRLPDRPAGLPKAPSRVWPTFGTAMLRSDESSGYWTNPDAIAVFQLMTRGYSHHQHDKLEITLFGAGRLLYPDFLAFQYETPRLRWTNWTASKNTMVVDEQNTGTAEPSIRHEFSPDVKYLATAASGVYEGVEQTRALMLTGEYLLDLFQASSKTPHTYDYNLRSLGQARPLTPEAYEPVEGISDYYWALEDQHKMTTSASWQLEFVLRDKPGDDPPLGPEWYEHEAHVRVTMAGAPQTRVWYGTWGRRKFLMRAAEIYGERATGRPRYPHMGIELGTLVVRREGLRDTAFVATHEPYANEARPSVRTVTVLASTPEAMVVQVDAEGFTDYAAIAWGREGEKPLHTLVPKADARQRFCFRNYGFLRVPKKGPVVARGGWEGVRVPHEGDGAMLRGGQPHEAQVAYGYLTFGSGPAE
jgi:hypothetical protein